MKTVHFRTKQITIPSFFDTLKGILYMQTEIGPTTFTTRLIPDESETNIFKDYTSISFNYERASDYQFKILLILEMPDSNRVNLASFNIPLKTCPRNKLISTNFTMTPYDTEYFNNQEHNHAFEQDEVDSDYDNDFNIFFEVHRSEDGSKPFQANLGTLKLKDLTAPDSISSINDSINQNSLSDSNAISKISQIINLEHSLNDEFTDKDTLKDDEHKEIFNDESVNSINQKTIITDQNNKETNPPNDSTQHTKTDEIQENHEINNLQPNENETESTHNNENKDQIEINPINEIQEQPSITDEQINDISNQNDINEIHDQKDQNEISEVNNPKEQIDTNEINNQKEKIDINDSNNQKEIAVINEIVEFNNVQDKFHDLINDDFTDNSDFDDDIPEFEPIPNYQTTLSFNNQLPNLNQIQKGDIGQNLDDEDDNESIPAHESMAISQNQNEIRIDPKQQNDFIEPPFSVHQADNPYQNEPFPTTFNQPPTQNMQSYGHGIPQIYQKPNASNNGFLGYPTIQQIYSFTAPNVPPT